MSLADILEGAASALPDDADAIRPANGDPFQLLALVGADGGTRVLTWLLVHEPESGAELALAWMDLEGGPEVIAALEEDALPKTGRKALRRVLHGLRSRGIPLPRRAPRATVARLPQIEDDIEAAYVSALDPRGARLCYLVEPNPAGGARLFEMLLDEARGVVDFEVYSAGRSRIRRFVRDAAMRSRFPAVSAPPAALRALVARIVSRHPVGRAFPQGFGEWRSTLAVAGETPGDLARQALGAEPDEEALARAVELVKKGALGPWGPAARELAEMAETALQEMAKQESGQEDWAPLAARLYGDERASATAMRLRESAWVLWKLDRLDDARACLHAAETFDDTDAPQGPVAAALTEALLAPALDGLRARPATASEEAAGGEE